MGHSFRLQPVLDHRDRLEKSAQQKLAETLRRQEELVASVTGQRQELKALELQLLDKQVRGIRVGELSLYQAAIRTREMLIASRQQELAELNEQILQHRKELSKTSQDRRMVEKLKQRSRLAWQQQEKQRDNKQLDEMALRSGKANR